LNNNNTTIIITTFYLILLITNNIINTYKISVSLHIILVDDLPLSITK
jgi:hypothetical protein